METKNLRSFSNLGALARHARLANTNLSQSQVSYDLGYKNGQFISNVERGLCNIPLKAVFAFSVIVKCSVSDIKCAMLRDFEETFTNFVDQYTPEEAEDAIDGIVISGSAVTTHLDAGALQQ